MVFGPSGAGKTTLLRALSTLLPPSKRHHQVQQHRCVLPRFEDREG
ncbi:ATP-binding cassette domain-containing protein [Thermococcus sp.]|nr:ATP-binding cassette domain-containing protein [Thermococcus sp.]